MKTKTQILTTIKGITRTASEVADKVQKVLDWLDESALSGHDMRPHIDVWNALVEACNGRGKKVLDAGHLALYVKERCYFRPVKDDKSEWLVPALSRLELKEGDRPETWEAMSKAERSTHQALWKEQRIAEHRAALPTRTPWHQFGKTTSKNAVSAVFDAELKVNNLIDALLKAQKSAKAELVNGDLVDYLIKARDAWEKDRKEKVSESV